MNYELKDKIDITRELLSELEIKSWQEIEHLQTQIANVAEGPVNDKLRQLFKNLLTSYYVFAGGIETLLSEPNYETQKPAKAVLAVATGEDSIETIDEPVTGSSPVDFTKGESDNVNSYEVSEPFEYFVDFDEPIGNPISDEDLYG